jgi:hypothetical protein
MHFVEELFFVCCERLDSSTGRLTLVQKTVVRTECSFCACLVFCLLISFELMKELITKNYTTCRNNSKQLTK